MRDCLSPQPCLCDQPHFYERVKEEGWAQLECIQKRVMMGDREDVECARDHCCQTACPRHCVWADTYHFALSSPSPWEGGIDTIISPICRLEKWRPERFNCLPKVKCSQERDNPRMWTKVYQTSGFDLLTTTLTQFKAVWFSARWLMSSLFPETSITALLLCQTPQPWDFLTWKLPGDLKLVPLTEGTGTWVHLYALEDEAGAASQHWWL